MNNKGSTLVLLIIIMALVIVLATTALHVAVKQYEIKKFNTETKQSLYMSETGLNESYVRTCILMVESISKGVQLAEEYLEINPLNTVDAENIFINNYKLHITSNIRNTIKTSVNSSAEIFGNSNLVFVDDVLKVIIRSSYVSEFETERVTLVDMVIAVPKFDDVSDSEYDVKDYIELTNWVI